MQERIQRALDNTAWQDAETWVDENDEPEQEDNDANPAL